MAYGIEDLDDLTWDLEEDGQQVRRQLDRRIVTHRGWATAVYLFQERDPRDGAWRPPRATIVRFRKTGAGWRKHAAINIGSPAVADAIAGALAGWFGEGGKAATTDEED